jgi:hypothetical protein
MGRQQFSGGSTATSGSGNGGYYGGGPQQANDVIDLGEEISKKAKPVISDVGGIVRSQSTTKS